MLGLPEKEYSIGEVLKTAGAYEEFAEIVDKRFKPETIKKATRKILSSAELFEKEELYTPRMDWDRYFEKMNSENGNHSYILNLKDEKGSVRFDLKFSKKTGKLYGEIRYHNGREIIPINERIEEEDIRNLSDSEEYKKGFDLPVADSKTSSRTSTVSIDPKFQESLKFLKGASFLDSLNFVGNELLDLFCEKDNYECLLSKVGKNRKSQEKFESWLEDNLYYYLRFTGAMLDEGIGKVWKDLLHLDSEEVNLNMTSRLFKSIDIHTKSNENMPFLPDTGANVAKKYMNSIWALSNDGFLFDFKKVNRILKSKDNEKIFGFLEKIFPRNLIEEIEKESIENLSYFIDSSSECEKYRNALIEYIE